MMRKLLSKEEQKQYLLSRIGDAVNFKYPEPPYLLKGKLLDRYVIAGGEDEWVAYWNIIDLISFENEDEKWLRITYFRYKKKDRRWVFAGQTSLTDPISSFRDLFVNAVKEKDWIRPLFKEVCRQCKRELKLNGENNARNRFG
jgi:hypothetical protein